MKPVHADKIKEMLLAGIKPADIVTQLGCAKSTVSYHRSKLNLDSEKKRIYHTKYDWEEISKYYHSEPSITVSNCIEVYGFSKASWTKAVNSGKIIPKDRTIKYEQLFCENSVHSRNTVKSFILKNKLIPYVCEQCALEDKWNNKPLTLQLDHINGIYNDNRLENLRWLCPNCHSQTDTFGSKNPSYK